MAYISDCVGFVTCLGEEGLCLERGEEDGGYNFASQFPTVGLQMLL